MSKLYFKVASDWEEVVRLRNEIAKLKQELKNIDSTQSPTTFKTLNTQLAASNQRLDELVTNAAKAGAEMEGSFKKKIFDASQTINGFTEKIIAQKSTIKGFEQDLRALQEEYRKITKNGGKNQNALDSIHRMKNIITEEKDALFTLTQQQAEARLSVKRLRDEYALYNDNAKKVVEKNNGIAISWKKAVAVIGGTGILKALGSEMIRIRGEFQAADTAIQTLLGNKEKADTLMAQVREYAKISPLEFSDVTKATQMMLGFNIEAEKVPRYLQAIGDVSMGDTQRFNSLTLAFSQMSAAGKLMGQDLNQMINAGFNPLQMISEKTGKSIATLKEEMSKGAISAEMVQQAFLDATSAGGKFYNMSENASKTINGQISMMQDALDNVFNELGTKGEGVIMGAIQTTTSLIENYETVGKILAGLIATYGTYKAALIINIALTRSWAVAARADAVAKGIQTIATKAQTVAQLALNAAMKANPYVLAATLIVGAATAMWAFRDSTTAAERAQKKYNKTKADSLQKEEEHKSRLEELIATIQNEYTSSMNRVKAIDAIKKEYPSLFQKYIDEKGHIKDLIGLWKEYNEEVSKNKVETNKKNLSDSTAKIEEYEKMLSLWKKLGENPYYRKKRLSKEELELAEKYKLETESSLRRKLELAKPSRDLYQKDVRSDELAQWQLDLKKSTDAQIKTELEEMKRLQQARKNNKRYSLNVGVGSLKGATTEGELANRIDILQSEYDSRSKTTYKQDYEKAKKDWEDAKKKLSEIEKDKSKFTSKQYEEAKKREETAEKAYKDLGGITGSALSKQKKAADKQKKDQQKSAEELLSLRRQNQQAEIDLMKEGTEKKLKQIDLDYQKELDAIKKQEKELSEKQKGKLTLEQSTEISDRYTNAENKRDKAIADITKEQLKAEQQALNDYLKEYGTFQQQKFAIAQEYAEKIKKVQEESGVNSAQVKLLEKQRDVAIQNKETEAIKANIDWVTVFGEFGSMFNDMIKPALEEAKKYIQTDKFKSSDQDSQKALIDAINQMEKALGGAGGLNFKKLGQDIKTYQLAEQNRLISIEEEIMAHEKLAKAQDDYNKALKNGTEEEKQAAQNALETAQQNANAASMNVQAQTSAANEIQQSLTNTATALKANMENVTSGLQKLASGGIKNAYEGLLQIGKGAGGAMEKFADKLDKVPIVGWIISIIDVFKDGLSDFVGTLLDSIFNAVSGILSDILSGDFFVTLGKSIRDGVGNIFNAISFGGFDSLINKISGSNAKEVQEAIDRLTDRNETLEKSIDRLTDVMDKSAGSKSISAYEQAYKYQKEQIDNTLKIAREQARYSNAHHSWQYYMGWTDEQLSWIRENVDKNFSGTNSLWGLPPEQMRELLSNADIYEQIKSSGKGGYGERVMEKLEAYADQAGKLDELTEKINESLMQISFDGLRDNFLESLMDMDKDAKSFSEDFSEYMQRALLNFSMGELFDDELREWYNGIAKLMKENGGKLTKEQLEDARKEYDKMVQDAMNERDKIAEITGYTGSSSSSQEASKKGFATASQNSIDELTGRFTALQIAGEEIKNQNVVQSQSFNILTMKADTLLSINTEMRNIADDTRNLIANSYLELVQISENTGAIVKPIQQIQKDIAEVKNNTKGLSTK
ncbi:tape measure protein [Candidatus Bacteroides intestinigallinarum]|jgi:tape measure domain-containing protein|uniref:tape measure protein n=1 Tax=Candidatus Bacteroides intestinigallinarum TaxID=2838470 RepID=UPI0039B42CCD